MNTAKLSLEFPGFSTSRETGSFLIISPDSGNFPELDHFDIF